MHTRSKAAATALLLTASTAGLAAVRRLRRRPPVAPRVGRPRGHAHGDHQVNEGRPEAVGRQAPSRQHACSRSSVGAPEARSRCCGSRQGYSLKKAASDFGKAFAGRPPTSQAVSRIDKNVVFYGGMPVPAKGAKPNVGREHRQGRQVLRAEPRQEHADDA